MPSHDPPSADRDFRSNGDGPETGAEPIDFAEIQPLWGRRLLVVEDEYLIAEDVSALLREAGATVIGPANSLPEGMRLAGDTEQIDGAVLNIDLGGVAVFPLADELQARGVRILFLTGYGDGNIPDEYAAIPRCKKPTGAACVVGELLALLRPIAA